MTQVTDRLVNSDIVELAKQRYETEKKSKIPTAAIELTSKGLIYPESHPLRKGFVNMRHMSAYDEDIIVNETYIKKGIMFDMLLAELITDHINVDDIAVVDQEGLIINAYIMGYGSDYDANVTDPTTGKTLSRTIDLSTLPVKHFTLVPDTNGEFEYVVNNDIKLKFKYANNHMPEKSDENRIISKFLKRIIMEVNGDRSPAAIDDFLKYSFTPKESKKFRAYYADNAPGIVKNIEVEGENGDTFTSKFQFDPTVFWS